VCMAAAQPQSWNPPVSGQTIFSEVGWCPNSALLMREFLY
jgi:hypothetical protein